MKFLRRFPKGVVVVLALQYLLGMYNNMYATLPEGGDINADWDFAHKSWTLMTHVTLGGLLLLSSLAYLIRTIMLKQKQLLPYAIIGFVSILAAFIGGERFMATQNDLFSMLMASGFLGAIITYLLAWRVPVDVKQRS